MSTGRNPGVGAKLKRVNGAPLDSGGAGPDHRNREGPHGKQGRNDMWRGTTNTARLRSAHDPPAANFFVYCSWFPIQLAQLLRELFQDLLRAAHA